MIRRIIRINTLLLIVIATVATSQLSAQDDFGIQLYRPALAVKISPLALISIIPSANIGLEIKTFPNQSVQLEYGYINDLNISNNLSFTGQKLSTEYRFYNRKTDNKQKNRFWGVHYKLQQVNTSGNVALWRQNRSYQEILPIRVSNTSHSFYLIGGQVFNLYKKLSLELVVGLGRKRLIVEVKDAPEDAEVDNIIESSFLSPVQGEGKYSLATLLFNIRVIYQIK